MQTQPISINDVEGWNDAFARENDIDDYYARSSPVIRWIERRRLTCIRKIIAATSEHRILEVGCGGGHVLRLFPQSDLTGVDVSGEMLRKAQRNLCRYSVRLLKGELHELDLPDASFDRVICTEVLEHTLDPESILEGIHRLLRPDGRAVITFPNDHLIDVLKGGIRRSGLTMFPPFARLSWGSEDYHLHVWKVNEMRALLSRYFDIRAELFAPFRSLPIRCCFHCTRRR
jgi:SAM-dependent methyltransferase